MEKIVLSPTSRKEIDAKYGAPNVSKALNFRSNSLLCREIRQVAMNELGGIIMEY